MPTGLATVGELAGAISEEFGLSVSGAGELQMIMDGFALLPGSAASLIRDGDLVKVQRAPSQRPAGQGAVGAGKKQPLAKAAGKLVLALAGPPTAGGAQASRKRKAAAPAQQPRPAKKPAAAVTAPAGSSSSEEESSEASSSAESASEEDSSSSGVQHDLQTCRALHRSLHACWLELVYICMCRRGRSGHPASCSACGGSRSSAQKAQQERTPQGDQAAAAAGGRAAERLPARRERRRHRHSTGCRSQDACASGCCRRCNRSRRQSQVCTSMLQGDLPMCPPVPSVWVRVAGRLSLLVKPRLSVCSQQAAAASGPAAASAPGLQLPPPPSAGRQQQPRAHIQFSDSDAEEATHEQPDAAAASMPMAVTPSGAAQQQADRRHGDAGYNSQPWDYSRHQQRKQKRAGQRHTASAIALQPAQASTPSCPTPVMP